MLRKRIEGLLMILIPIAIIAITILAWHLNPKPASIRRVDVVGLGYFIATFVMVVVEIVLMHDRVTNAWEQKSNKK